MYEGVSAWRSPPERPDHGDCERDPPAWGSDTTMYEQLKSGNSAKVPEITEEA